MKVYRVLDGHTASLYVSAGSWLTFKTLRAGDEFSYTGTRHIVHNKTYYKIAADGYSLWTDEDPATFAYQPHAAPPDQKSVDHKRAAIHLEIADLYMRIAYLQRDLEALDKLENANADTL